MLVPYTCSSSWFVCSAEVVTPFWYNNFNPTKILVSTNSYSCITLLCVHDTGISSTRSLQHVQQRLVLTMIVAKLMH